MSSAQKGSIMENFKTLDGEERMVRHRRTTSRAKNERKKRERTKSGRFNSGCRSMVLQPPYMVLIFKIMV